MIVSGRDRNTRDVDVVVSEIPEALPAACAAEGFEHDPERDRFSFNGINLHRYWTDIGLTGLRWSIDVQQADTDFQRSILARRRVADFDDLRFPIATPADLILLKLFAFRPVDRADCIELVRMYGDVDRDYVLSWISRMGLETRWAEVLEAAEQP